MAEVLLEVLANGAIYVNGTRITDRSTKPWAGSNTIFETKCQSHDVLNVLTTNEIDVSKIDDSRYKNNQRT